MERATGIGGVFLRSRDPVALARWYTEHLGVTAYSEEAEGTWWQEAGPTVWSPFPTDTDYFGRREQGWMIRPWTASADSAGGATRRGTGSSCGSRRRRR